MDHSVQAVIVGKRVYGEAHLVLRLLTDSGCMSVFAPQARRSTKRFGGALELFSSIEARVQTRRKEGFPVAQSFELTKLRLGLGQDLERLSLAAYWAELVSRGTPEGEATPLRRLLEVALDRLCHRGASSGLRRRFELTFLEALGLQPQLNGCVRCGMPGRYLDFREGGLLCSVHRGVAKEIGPKTLAFLEQQDVLPPEDEDRAARAVARPLDLMIDSLLASPLASRKMLASLGL